MGKTDTIVKCHSVSVSCFFSRRVPPSSSSSSSSSGRRPPTNYVSQIAHVEARHQEALYFRNAWRCREGGGVGWGGGGA